MLELQNYNSQYASKDTYSSRPNILTGTCVLPSNEGTDMKKLKKLLLKWFMPSAEQIADMAVKVAADFINSSDKTELIAKYGSAADEFTKV